MRDHALEKTIAHALAVDPRVDDDTIAVECVAGGHVVLRGSAESPAKATRALRTADGVAGARDVEDQLRPRRPGVGRRQDARTEAAVLRAFISDDALPAETIHVTASDGTVTLSGGVDFPYQRDEAEAVARQVPGVSQIRNHLSVWIAVSPNEVLDAGGRRHRRGQRRSAHRDRPRQRRHADRNRSLHGDRDAAIAAAAGAPMVAGVEDEIRVLA